MDLICRICQRSERDELISISCRSVTFLKRICDLISSVTGLSVEQFDRLPQHVCSECFGRLDRTYRLWELCRNVVRKEVLHQKQQNVHRCRICCALIEGNACKKLDMAIGGMVQHLTGASFEINDNSPSWFVCKNCPLELDAAYEFKSKCIESEARLLQTMSFMWERMEVDPCNPEHLVMDLYAEAVQEQNVLEGVHCSVCLLDVEMQQLGEKCKGCMLQFRNYDEIRSVQASLCVEKNSRTSSVDMDSAWVEETLSQEFVLDERDQECSIKGDIMFEANTRVDNDNHPEITESNNTCLVYIGDYKTQYAIFEKYPDDPFPKAQPTGPACCKCMTFFDTRLELEAHTKQKHRRPTGKGEYFCDVCRSLFADQQSLKLHKAKLQTFFYDFCRSCQIVLTSPYVFLQHKNTFHQEFETGATEGTEANDERMVEASLIKPTIEPPEGSFPVKVETNFETEILVTYDCCLQNCRNRYSSEEQLLQHLNTDHYQPEKLLENVCQYCEMQFPNETALLKHSNRKVERNKYRCLIGGCGFKCFFINSIVQHCNEKPHIRSKTEQQQKPTKESGPMDLKQLSLVANKFVCVDENSTNAIEPTNQPTEGSSPTEHETKFKTDILETYECCLRNCKTRYSSEEQLKKHMNTAHYQSNQVLGNVCQYCNMKFRNKTNLRNHCNRKFERKSYRCLIDGCGFTRTLRSAIIQHCSQEPHVKYISANDAKNPSAMIKSQPLDLKHFSVVRQMDDNTDVVERKSELCCRCFLLFDSKEELTKHCEQHSTEGGQPFHCLVCGRGFLRKSTYTIHINLTKNPIHYFCRVCETMMWTNVEYKIHKAGFHFPEDKNAQIETTVDDFLTCCGCQQPFGTEAELVEHRREKHHPRSTSSSATKCDHCHKGFSSLKELEKHVNHYESKITYKCKLPSCVFSTKNIEQMRRHVLAAKHLNRTAVPSDEPSEYFCCIKGCDFRCHDYDTLIKHGTALHAQKREYLSIAHSDRQYKCPVCGKGFTNEISMRKHKTGRHEQRHYCPGCELYVPLEERSSHAQCVEKLRIKCEICDKLLASQIALKQHIKMVHLKDPNESEKRKKHVCIICGKKVAFLPTHMEKHENRRSWECKICAARFNHAHLLKTHHRVHTDERNFACRYGCEKRYKGNGDRDRHERLVHLGITPFRCEVCDAAFIRLRDLQLHQRKHTGLKLYSCSHCYAGFNKKSEYDDHCRQCKDSDL